MSKILSPTEQYINRAMQTLDYLDTPSLELRDEIVVVGGAALAMYLHRIGVLWEHPTLSKGEEVDLDVLANSDTFNRLRDMFTGDHIKRELDLVKVSGYPEARGITMGPKDGSDLLQFTAITPDPLVPELTGRPDGVPGLADMGKYDLYIVSRVDGWNVLIPEWVLRWKATHGRPKDEEVIDSVLEANSQHKFLGEEAVRSIDRIRHNTTSQGALF